MMPLRVTATGSRRGDYFTLPGISIGIGSRADEQALAKALNKEFRSLILPGGHPASHCRPFRGAGRIEILTAA